MGLIFLQSAAWKKDFIRHRMMLYMYFNISCRIGYADILFCSRWYFVRSIEKRFYLTTGLAASLAVYDGSRLETIRSWWDSSFPYEKADYFDWSFAGFRD